MSAVAIRAEGLGKKYTVGAQREKYNTLRESIMASGARLRNREPKQEFWALRDVDLEVRAGEVLGIIGRNGAGKSTLLKILSRITDPTSGWAEIHGRVGSLLEVGSGFNMELTGRENVYLNGAILGMRSSEIDRKFDEIVAFAEVQPFIDTPVKRYSSGMYMRLAFAVAAHLEPEILLVDEVLAVGDVAFQRKCLGRMGDIARGGRTVLFVSHNLAAVRRLTERCVYLVDGAVAAHGATDDVIDRYLADSVGSSTSDLSEAKRWDSNSGREIELVAAEPTPATGIFGPDEQLTFRVTTKSRAAVEDYRMSLTVFGSDGQPVGSAFSGSLRPPFLGATAQTCLRLEAALAPGRYFLALATGAGDPSTGHRDFDVVLECCHFEVAPLEGIGQTIGRWETAWGPMRLELSAEEL